MEPKLDNASDEQNATKNSEDDLDSLLSEYDTTSSSAENESTNNQVATPETSSNDVAELVNYLKADREAKAQESMKADINSAVEMLSKNIDIPDRFLRGALHEKADSDPRFAKAFADRESNPQGWNKVLGALNKELNSYLTNKPDQDATNNHNEIIAAVQGATSNSQEQNANSDYKSMSDAEFNKEVAGMF